ncbi:MAG: SUMF1/EgtB/PvdO family nonheme iron enzyme [Rhodopila sp.]
MRDRSQWWTLLEGANWRQPCGPGSSIKGLGNHPVAHVTCKEALPNATRTGKVLPTEAEWEFAARRSLDGAKFGWGDPCPMGAPWPTRGMASFRVAGGPATGAPPR